MERTYIAIDLKSFYASVECEERGLDPLDALLVVADESRTEKTICLAVSPALKKYGVSGRARLFQALQRQREVNIERKRKAPAKQFREASCSEKALREDASLEMRFVIAPPRMSKYMEVSTRIFALYKTFVSPEDIHVYSIDEVFIDATGYLKQYGIPARELAMRMVRSVLSETGITATCGIGTNLYLCKVAMDIVAKHIPPDADGVRIAELDEMSYRKELWNHRPLTDFWRIGRGIARKLQANGLYTMGDVAAWSLTCEEKLYKLFGVNAELIIDHAWGWESCTMQDIKAYRPQSNSISTGQVLHCAYTHEMAALIVREMADELALQLVEKKQVTQLVSLTICFDTENLTDPARRRLYKGPTEMDFYGREVPKAMHATVRLARDTSSARLITEALMRLYESRCDRHLLVRRLYLAAEQLKSEGEAETNTAEQTDLFTDYAQLEKQQAAETERLNKEKKLQQTVLQLKNRFGKNAVLRGMNMEQGATTAQRNAQIGGHKA